MEGYMKDRFMWTAGIALALFTAGLMVWTDSDIAPLVALAMMAVVFIAIGARARRSRHH
jgi:hypothetical protein